MSATRTSLLAKLFRRTPKTYRHPKPARARLGLTALEAREVPAAVTAALAGDVLTVTGTAAGDTITVVQAGATITTAGKTFPAAAVTKVVINAGGGNDLIGVDSPKPIAFDGGAGDDTIYSSTGNDTLRGGTGNDWMTGYDGNDVLVGDAGDDTLTGGLGNDTLSGGAGNDWEDGYWGYDRVSGDGGNDTIYGGEQDDVVSGGGGNDFLYGFSGNDHLDGNDGNDSVFGDSGNDTLYGGLGNDTLDGFWGTDQLDGNDGDDSLFGGEGPDYLTGGPGNDTLQGYWGDDYMDGNDGNDSLFGDSGNDKLWGGPGNDTLDGFWGDDRVDGNSGFDTLYGGEGNDEVYGGENNDRVFGYTGDDTLRGGTGDDTIYGGDGADTLYGEAGTDWLYGEGGNDGLFAGTGDGREYLTGGAGDDRFLIPAGQDRAIDFDWVRDARLTFTDSPALSGVLMAGQTGTYSFAAGAWDNGQVERVDVALGNLMRLTGNTRLLKRADWGEMGFVAVGRQTDANAFRSGGWNDRDAHQIVYVDLPSLTAISVQETVYHEFGHNWDEPEENPWANAFRAVSGWVQTTRPGAGYTASTGVVSATQDDNWYYLTSAAGTFARTYGKTNPNEDMGTTWEAYFVNQYHGGATGLTNEGLTASAAKWATLDSLFGFLRLAA